MDEITSISFSNYKGFASEQKIDIRPITILIGKNSSGKSSIAKLFPLIEQSLSKRIKEPLFYKNIGVELGASFTDLIYNKEPANVLSFKISLLDEREIFVSILSDGLYNPQIIEWEIKDKSNNIILKYDITSKSYKDSEGKEYDCEFRGFIPEKIIEKHTGVNVVDNYDLSINLNLDYIGPFRILPDRIFSLSGQLFHSKIGVKGENAYNILAVSKLQSTDLHTRVGSWFVQNFEGWQLVVNESANPYFEIQLTKETSTYSTDSAEYGQSVKINIVDVGQGMNQALPLVVRAYMPEKQSLIITEQPELHLHPAAHGNLAELFVRSSKQNNQKYIIETHSENMILRLRKLIIENDFNFTPDDLVIYWVDEADKGKVLTKITVDANGVLSDWPEDVFTENVKEILDMQKAIAKKAKK